jgi:hypothetical protein
LWLDFPSRGGTSPDLPVQLEPNGVEYFRVHSSQVRAIPDERQLNWVAASGVTGLRGLSLVLAKGEEAPRKYTVRLHFAEVGRGKTTAPPRVFDVLLQGKKVLDKLDVAAEAGMDTALTKTFEGVEVTNELRVSLVPAGDDPAVGPILCGVEVSAEGW